MVVDNEGFAAFSENSPLEKWNYRIRDPNTDEVLIKVDFCGICHSDIHTARNEWKKTNYPVVPGHELVGKIVKCGNAVKDFEVGEPVAVGVIVDSCGKCETCIQGYEQLCDKVGKTYNGVSRGEKTYGGYGKYLVCRADFVFKIPFNLKYEDMAPLLCAGITTYSPIKKHQMERGGLKIGIIGLGGLGHMAVQFASKMNSSNEVYCISRTSAKKQLAKTLGARDIIIIDSINSEHIQSFDYLIDTVSAVDKPVTTYLSLLKAMGTLIMVGLPPVECCLKLDAASLVQRNRNLQGSLTGGRKEIKEMLQFCANNDILPLVEHIKPIEINEAYERVIKGDVKFRFIVDIES